MSRLRQNTIPSRTDRKQSPTAPIVMFRCDGGNIPETGTGHVRRCLNLALYLRDHHGIECRFIIRHFGFAPPQVLSHRFAVHLLPPVTDWEPLAVKIVNKVEPHLMVVDLLNEGGRFLKMLNSEIPGLPTITMDDTGDGLKHASVSINAILEHESATYNGPNYAILASSDEHPVSARKNVEEIFLCFGGYDHGNLTAKALESLSMIKKPLRVTALVSKGYSEKESLSKLAKMGNITSFDLIRETSNIGHLLKKADLGIVSGGLTLFEAMHCGLPTLALCQYEHQAETARRYQEMGAVVSLGLGSDVDLLQIAGKVESLIDDRPLRTRLSKKGADLVDGRGIYRVADIIRDTATTVSDVLSEETRDVETIKA